MTQSDSTCPKCGSKLSGDDTQGLCPGCVLGQIDTDLFSDPELDSTADHEFPGYTDIEKIGQGGMSHVFRAKQESSGKIVALKVMAGRYVSHPEFEERFLREGEAMAQLDHPNIVTIYESNRTEGGVMFFAMEFVDGVSLRDLIREGMTAPQILEITQQVCDALNHAHEQGLVHRDVKPGNILITREGVVKVADFGLAKIEDELRDPELSSLTLTNVAMGTPDYMAPEQRTATRDVDQRADIYSLGVVLYEMFTGKLPLGSFKPPSKIKSGVSIPIDQLVEKAMEAEPDDRFEKIGEVKNGLEAAINSPPFWSRRKVLLSSVGGLAAAAGAAFFISGKWKGWSIHGSGNLRLIPMNPDDPEVTREMFPRAPWDRQLVKIKSEMHLKIRNTLWFAGLDDFGKISAWGPAAFSKFPQEMEDSFPLVVDFDFGNGSLFGYSSEGRFITVTGTESKLEPIQNRKIRSVIDISKVLWVLDENGQLSCYSSAQRIDTRMPKLPKLLEGKQIEGIYERGTEFLSLTADQQLITSRVKGATPRESFQLEGPLPVEIIGGAPGYLFVMPDGRLRLFNTSKFLDLPDKIAEIDDAEHCVYTRNRGRSYLFIRRKSGAWCAFRENFEDGFLSYERLRNLEPQLDGVADVQPGLGYVFAIL